MNTERGLVIKLHSKVKHGARKHSKVKHETRVHTERSLVTKIISKSEALN